MFRGLGASKVSGINRPGPRSTGVSHLQENPLGPYRRPMPRVIGGSEFRVLGLETRAKGMGVRFQGLQKRN